MAQGWSAGKRLIEGRGELYTRSMAEANWARWLQFLKERGDVREWWYEPMQFEFEPIRHGTTRYTPDFLVLHPDGSHHWDELKGWKRPKGETALKRMALYHPEVELRVISWEQFRAIERQVLGLVPGWEVGVPKPDRRTIEGAIQALEDSVGDLGNAAAAIAADEGLPEHLVEHTLAQGGTIEQLRDLGGRGRRKP